MDLPEELLAQLKLLSFSKNREVQIQALHQEGIFLEEEYRDEIHYCMQDMEVSSMSNFHASYSNPFLQPLVLYYIIYSVNGSTA